MENGVLELVEGPPTPIQGTKVETNSLPCLQEDSLPIAEISAGLGDGVRKAKEVATEGGINREGWENRKQDF